jgi:RHS repeat-associated protein
MKKSTKQLLGLLFLISLTTQAQVDILKSGNYTVTATETLTASNSIRLLPNTWVKSGSTFVARIDPNLLPTQPSTPYTPPSTSNENYILTRVFKTPMQAETGITDAKDVLETITYFDGLGRPIQQIAHRQSGSGKDIVTPIEYDGFGRQDKEYLPYVSTTPASLSYISTALTDVLNFPQYSGQKPFAQKQFEASPLNRVLKQAAPGTDWALGSGHEIKLDYQTNTAADAVKLFSVTASWEAAKGLYDIPTSLTATDYQVGQLYKTITYDENTAATPTESNGATVEFKNKEGQVVLKRAYESGIKHDTYYVYDQYGNLTFVIPPLVNATSTITQTILEGLCYQYKYDSRNRLVEKKLPSKGWEFIVYDKLDRVVATGPAFSPFSDSAAGTVGWLITKYDVFNRAVYTGWEQSAAITNAERKTKQNTMDGLTKLSESKTSSGTIDGIAAYYTNTVAPTSFKLLTVNYYDNYTFPTIPSVPTSVEGQSVLSSTKSLATGSWVRVLTSTTATAGETSTLFYDAKARPIRSYLTNYLGGYTYTDTHLDFLGVPQYTKTYHKRLATDTEVYTKEAFTYSPQGRLLTHTHQVNSSPAQLLTSNTYDELGQLISKKVGNTLNSPLQKVDYAYNIRGWLTNINDITNLNQGSDPKDLFSFKINYNTTAGNVSGVKPFYNGNIAETYWRTGSDNIQRKYGYQYDNLNRLKNAIYQKPGGNTYPTYEDYSEKNISYDKNGNIQTLYRNGDVTDALPANGIDNLVYTYTTNTNTLQNVMDNTNNTSGFNDGNKSSVDYTYDLNGNLKTDANKGITKIVYNHLNLPIKIEANMGVMYFVYNALGQKVQKISQGVSATGTTDYLSGFQYNQSVTANTSILQFFPTAEGYVKNSAGVLSYVFNYTDHLGNVRVSYEKDAITGSLKIIDENNYYPFGLKHSPYNAYAPVVKNMYKFNGKEFQDELFLNLYDFGGRLYDPTTIRTTTHDPLAEKFYSLSPQSFLNNNPLSFIDPTGMMSEEYNKKPDDDHFDSSGNFMYRDFRSTNNIVIHTGIVNFSQMNDEVQLKDFTFNESNYSTLSKISNHYSKPAGVDLGKVYNGKISVADEVITGHKGGQPEGYINKYNDGVYSPKILDGSEAIMTTKGSKVTIQLSGGRVHPLLNDANNFTSTLDHEGGKIGHLVNPEKTHTAIYKDQIEKYSKTVTPQYNKLLKENLEYYKNRKE